MLIIEYNIDSDRLEKSAERADELFEQTYEACADGDAFSADHEADFDTITGCIKTLQIKVMDMLTRLKEKTPASTPSPTFKLERIRLPQFNGNFADWQSFRDLFIASVHKNKTLSGAEKIIHLKSCLTVEAACIVSSSQATEANFQEAWTCVLKRHDCLVELVGLVGRKSTKGCPTSLCAP